MNRLGVLMVAAVVLPAPASSQDLPSVARTCTYDTCALRMNGDDVLAGQDGERVASFGFLAAPALGGWMETSDSVRHYLRVVESNYVSGGVWKLAGSLAMITGIIVGGAYEGGSGEWVGLGIFGAATSASLYGMRRQRRAVEAMDNAIWWYNQSLAGQSPASLSSFQVPAPGIQHDGRAGLVLGGTAGLGAGLLISSRHSADQWIVGLLETLVFGGLGGWLGWELGSNSPR